MEFVELSCEEFKKVQDNFSKSTYLQTVEWANIKKQNGWIPYYVGLKENNDIIGICLLLSRKVMLNKSIFYAPRGPIVNFENKEQVDFFIKKIKEFVKKHNGFCFKMDPMIEYRHHNSDGDVIDDGFNNQNIHDQFIKLGFKHKGFRVGYVDDLQYRWSYAINIDGKTYDEVFNTFSSKGRGHIRKALKYPFILKEVDDKNINDFKKITEHTASRHNHFDRTTEYYKSLIENFKKNNRIKVLVLYLEKKKYLESFENDKLYNVIKEEKEDLIPISCAMFIMDKEVVNYVYSGSFSKYNAFNASYMIQNEMIKYAVENHFKVYDFGGISGNFALDSEDYGVYAFKKNFNGYVIEYLGEYDLVTDKLYYFLYTKGYKIYRNSKKIFARLKGR